MKLGYPQTRLTPPEASFIRRSLFGADTEHELRSRIRAAQEDWAISVASDKLTEMLAGNEDARPIAAALMMAEYKESTEESITIDLSNVELSIIRSAAVNAVECAKENAMLTDRQYDDLYKSDESHEESLNESDEEMLKSSQFEDALRDIHMGRFIITAINEYYPG